MGSQISFNEPQRENPKVVSNQVFKPKLIAKNLQMKNYKSLFNDTAMKDL